VEVMLDFSSQHNLPGLLSEAYSGNGTEYTGDIGIPALALNDKTRITDAPSLYSLGTAYAIAPDSVERFLRSKWGQIEALFTDHGPWEGYNITQHSAIKFQTTAHTLALILGGIGSADINMHRYLTWQGLSALSKIPGEKSLDYDFLTSDVNWIPWSTTGDALDAARLLEEIHIRGTAVRSGAMTITLPQAGGVNLSNGTLKIRYYAAIPLEVVMTLAGGSKVFQNEIYTQFDVTDTEKEIHIPMPATPGLYDVYELVIRFGDEHIPLPVNLNITSFEFVPAG